MLCDYTGKHREWSFFTLSYFHTFHIFVVIWKWTLLWIYSRQLAARLNNITLLSRCYNILKFFFKFIFIYLFMYFYIEQLINVEENILNWYLRITLSFVLNFWNVVSTWVMYCIFIFTAKYVYLFVVLPENVVFSRRLHSDNPIAWLVGQMYSRFRMLFVSFRVLRIYEPCARNCIANAD